MADQVKAIELREEGPREGFQIEPGQIATSDKIALIDALSGTGLKHIQVASFVNPKMIPGWADADEVVQGFSPREDVAYGALWFNEKGLDRVLAHRDRLHLEALFMLCASDAFALRNIRRDHASQLRLMREQTRRHIACGVSVTRIGVMAAFGCNFSGVVPVERVVSCVQDGLEVAAEAGATIDTISLGDSMGWCSPARVEHLVGALRERWPHLAVALHLHDTRGQGIASAYAGLRMGVSSFDAAVAGLGGCPFAAQPGAAGNISTEELVLLCEDLGIETGVDLQAMIEVARLAERIVGHALPSTLLRAGCTM